MWNSWGFVPRTRGKHWSSFVVVMQRINHSSGKIKELLCLSAGFHKANWQTKSWKIWLYKDEYLGPWFFSFFRTFGSTRMARKGNKFFCLSTADNIRLSHVSTKAHRSIFQESPYRSCDLADGIIGNAVDFSSAKKLKMSWFAREMPWKCALFGMDWKHHSGNLRVTCQTRRCRPSEVGCTKRLREESGDGAPRDVESPAMVPLWQATEKRHRKPLLICVARNPGVVFWGPNVWRFLGKLGIFWYELHWIGCVGPVGEGRTDFVP